MAKKPESKDTKGDQDDPKPDASSKKDGDTSKDAKGEDGDDGKKFNPRDAFFSLNAKVEKSNEVMTDALSKLTETVGTLAESVQSKTVEPEPEPQDGEDNFFANLLKQTQEGEDVTVTREQLDALADQMSKIKTETLEEVDRRSEIREGMAEVTPILKRIFAEDEGEEANRAREAIAKYAAEKGATPKEAMWAVVGERLAVAFQVSGEQQGRDKTLQEVQTTMQEKGAGAELMNALGVAPENPDEPAVDPNAEQDALIEEMDARAEKDDLGMHFGRSPMQAGAPANTQLD